MAIRSIDDLDVGGKRVFCRLDLNVPLTEEGEVGDDNRIRAALPTLEDLLQRGSRVVAASHLGRPKGKYNEKLVMEPVGARLVELLSRDVTCTDDSIGDGVRKVVSDMRDGEIVLLENLRFHPEEEKNDPDHSRLLAELCDVYVNDAFGTAHRAHSSTEGLPRLVSDKAAGRLMFKEISFFSKLLKNPEKDFVAILGGAKVSDKIGVIKSLLDRVDKLIIGGAMANTFLAARGGSMGKSLVENDKLDTARDVIKAAQARSVEILLPEDVLVGGSMDEPAGVIAAADDIPDDMAAFDIGPETQRKFQDALVGAKTIFWNGPMGVFEKEVFAAGTTAIALAVADSGALSVVGGGDSVAAIAKAGVGDRISHISTGGGASLEMMEGRTLPGIAVLEE